MDDTTQGTCVKLFKIKLYNYYKKNIFVKWKKLTENIFLNDIALQIKKLKEDLEMQ